MPIDSSDIDNALLAKLGADTELLTLMPDNVFWDEAPANARQFVIVSLVEAPDDQQFGGRAFENPLYLVECRELSTAPVRNIKAAAARLDALLDPQPPNPPATLDVPGYGVLNIQREARIRLTEVDDRDESLRWNRRGGHYRVLVAPATA